MKAKAGAKKLLGVVLACAIVFANITSLGLLVTGQDVAAGTVETATAVDGNSTNWTFEEAQNFFTIKDKKTGRLLARDTTNPGGASSGLTTVLEPAELTEAMQWYLVPSVLDDGTKGWSVKNRATNEFLATTPEANNAALPRLEPVAEEYTQPNGSVRSSRFCWKLNSDGTVAPSDGLEATLNVHQWDDSGQSESAYIEVAEDGSVQPHIGTEEAAELASIWTFSLVSKAYFVKNVETGLYMHQINDTVDLQAKNENDKTQMWEVNYRGVAGPTYCVKNFGTKGILCVFNDQVKVYPASELGGSSTWDDARALMILSGNSTAVLTNTTCTINNLGGEGADPSGIRYLKGVADQTQEPEDPEDDMTITVETSKTGNEDQNWIFKSAKKYFTIQDKATGSYLAQGEGSTLKLVPAGTAVDDSMLWSDVNLSVVGVATLNIVNKKTGDFLGVTETEGAPWVEHVDAQWQENGTVASPTLCFLLDNSSNLKDGMSTTLRVLDSAKTTVVNNVYFKVSDGVISTIKTKQGDPKPADASEFTVSLVTEYYTITNQKTGNNLAVPKVDAPAQSLLEQQKPDLNNAYQLWKVTQISDTNVTAANAYSILNVGDNSFAWIDNGTAKVQPRVWVENLEIWPDGRAYWILGDEEQLVSGKTYTMSVYASTGYLKANSKEKVDENPITATALTGAKNQIWQANQAKSYFTITDKKSGKLVANVDGQLKLVPANTEIDDTVLWYSLELMLEGHKVTNIKSKADNQFIAGETDTGVIKLESVDEQWLNANGSVSSTRMALAFDDDASAADGLETTIHVLGYKDGTYDNNSYLKSDGDSIVGITEEAKFSEASQYTLTVRENLYTLG